MNLLRVFPRHDFKSGGASIKVILFIEIAVVYRVCWVRSYLTLKSKLRTETSFSTRSSLAFLVRSNLIKREVGTLVPIYYLFIVTLFPAKPISSRKAHRRTKASVLSAFNKKESGH